ncbi:hypothetical protein A9179_01315 [Pseudomonas alcaligenes]|uniref:histidine kinase n=1 Tax=Aquipseudomonas alcaligenes TaxID=43263 RepID=A0ABR7RV36_AQUAC|nr:ATP-binding protein [Pseudomonas alcaligenes]MBC9248903.1 hypothetical protein [Pseudomonas alcaligenes]
MLQKSLDHDEFSGDAQLMRGLARLRTLVISSALLWLAVVAVLAWLHGRRQLEADVAELAVQTNQYRDSALRIASQNFLEMSKITALLTVRADVLAIAEKYSALGHDFADLALPQRLALLKDDAQVRSTSAGLLEIVDDLRYDLIFVEDRFGNIIASSDAAKQVSMLGLYSGDRPYFLEAMQNAKGSMFSVGRTARKLGLNFSSRIDNGAGAAIGVVVARLPVERFVEHLSREGYQFIIIDSYGMIVASGDPDLVLQHVGPLSPRRPDDDLLKSYYHQDHLQTINLARYEGRLHDLHWVLNGKPILLSMAKLGNQGYQLGVFSSLRKKSEIDRAYLLIGALVGLMGIPVGIALYFLFAAQMRRAAAGRRLRAVNALLAHANEEKNRYLGIAAHDLRNPLSSLRGLSQLMLEMQLPEEQKHQFVNVIHRTSDELLNLVNDLLDVSNIEAGKIALSLAPVDLPALVRERLAHLLPQAEQKQIRIEFIASDIAALPVDKSRFGQVIDNLISNAIKFSPPGTVVTVRVADRNDGVEFAVEDQGPGISEADREHLFKSFQKLSAKPTAGEKSTGLGLSIVKSIVEAHGGHIDVESPPEGGARFVVLLPNFRSTAVEA